MMHTLGETIRARRLEMRWTQQRLADVAGCAKSYLSMIENDRRERPPSEEVLTRIERALRFEPGALVRLARWASAPRELRRDITALGHKARRLDDLISRLHERGVDELHRSGELQRLVAKLSGSSGEIPLAALPVQVPVINKVQAGYPSEFTDLGYPARVADEYVSAPDVLDADAFAARVVGDSMAPAYSEGDIVIFSPERDTPAGADCFVRFERDGETTFKRVYFEVDDQRRQLIRLQPLNSAYAPRVVRREEVAGMYAAVYVVRPVGGA